MNSSGSIQISNPLASPHTQGSPLQTLVSPSPLNNGAYGPGQTLPVCLTRAGEPRAKAGGSTHESAEAPGENTHEHRLQHRPVRGAQETCSTRLVQTGEDSNNNTNASFFKLFF